MGCWTGCGRVILIILNLLIMLISLAILAAGVLLKFFVTKVSSLLIGSYNVGELDQNTRDSFHIPDLEDIDNLPFVDEVGLVLMIFGCVLLSISFFACCGASCKWRPLLLMFIITMSILVIAQGTIGGMFLAKGSPLHEYIKTEVGDKVKNDFDNSGDSDAFTFSINMLQYLLGCCGIRGWEDYDPNKRPPTCCKQEIIDDGSTIEKQQCASDPPTAPDSYYNPKGCYELLLDTVLSDIALSAGVLSAILVIQVLEVIFAIMIMVDISDNNKVRPI